MIRRRPAVLTKHGLSFFDSGVVLDSPCLIGEEVS